MTSSINKGRRALFWILAAGLSMLLPTISAAPIQLHGLNYNTRQGPDWDPYKCKSRERIVTELQLLGRMTNRIRFLSMTDCGAIEVVLDVCKQLGMKIWMGLWVAQEVQTFLDEKAVLAYMLDRGLIDPNTVLGITVGSEAIYRGDVTIDQNIDYMNQVKSLMANYGLDAIPVTVVDIAETYMYNPRLTAAVDVVYANIFPYWENLSLDQAIPSMLEDLGLIQNQPEFQGKNLIIGETGWPDEGAVDGVQAGSVEGQVTFFEKFYCEVAQARDFEYFYFTGIDNDWRQIQDPNNPIEGNWGFLYSDLALKPHFETLSFTCADGTEYAFDETDWSLPGSTIDEDVSTPNPTPAPVSPSPTTPSPTPPPTPPPTTMSPTPPPTPPTTTMSPTPPPTTPSPKPPPTPSPTPPPTPVPTSPPTPPPTPPPTTPSPTPPPTPPPTTPPPTTLSPTTVMPTLRPQTSTPTGSTTPAPSPSPNVSPVTSSPTTSSPTNVGSMSPKPTSEVGELFISSTTSEEPSGSPSVEATIQETTAPASSRGGALEDDLSASQSEDNSASSTTTTPMLLSLLSCSVALLVIVMA